MRQRFRDALLRGGRRRQLPKARRVILGSAGNDQDGWCTSDRDVLDITRAADFRRYWKPGVIEAFVAEHVWEHLTPEHAREAVANCFRFLSPGGRLRVAVPDGLHPDPAYIEHVAPGGSGPGATDHKVLYDHRSMAALLAGAGFEVVLVEYWDVDAVFHRSEWDEAYGIIERSALNDSRNRERLTYTSLIVDAIKPA